jgi:methylamine dehydrogenase heavy chain
MITDERGSYIFDGSNGEMLGQLSHSWYTPAVVTLPSRSEAYYVDSFHSRGVAGTREDLLIVADLSTLTTKAEIGLPEKTATLHVRQHIALLNDERHMVVFNMTPAQSVSVVDVVDREFDSEISTPGCAIMMPSGERGFLMLCGDGALQLVTLDEQGAESGRTRSRPFFDVEADPVFDRVVYAGTGWLLVTHEGLVRVASTDDDRIEIGDAWSLLTDEDRAEKWRPGGRQPFSLHRATSLLYVLMHQGDVDTQDANGTEVWVFDIERGKRIARLELPTEAGYLLASQEPSPMLYVLDDDNKLQVYDGRRLRLVRTIEETGASFPLLQILAPHD